MCVRVHLMEICSAIYPSASITLSPGASLVQKYKVSDSVSIVNASTVKACLTMGCFSVSSSARLLRRSVVQHSRTAPLHSEHTFTDKLADFSGIAAIEHQHHISRPSHRDQRIEQFMISPNYCV